MTAPRARHACATGATCSEKIGSEVSALCRPRSSHSTNRRRFGAFSFDDRDLPLLGPAACFRNRNVTSADILSAADTLLLTYPDLVSVLNATTNGTEGAAGSVFRSADSFGAPAVLLLHNTSSRHALPIFLAELDAASVRLATGGRLNVSASVKALPLTQQERDALNTFLKLLASFFILVPFSYLPATYAAFSVRERAVQAKLLQLTSGCSPYAYWLAQLSWELFNHTAVVLLCCAIFAMYGMDVLIGTSDKGFGCFLLLELYGLAVIPLSFVYSFAFTNHSSAQVAIALANFVTGFCLVMASFIMGATPATLQLNLKLVNVYRIFPAFLLGEGLIALATADFSFSGGSGNSGGGGGAAGAGGAGGSNSTLGGPSGGPSGGGTNYTAGDASASNGYFADFFGSQVKRSAFEWGLLGRPLLLLVAEAFFYMALTFLVEQEQRRISLWVSVVRHWVADRVTGPIRGLLGCGRRRTKPATAAAAGVRGQGGDGHGDEHNGEFSRAALPDPADWVEDPGVARERTRLQNQHNHHHHNHHSAASSAASGADAAEPGSEPDQEEDAVRVLGLRKVFGAVGKASAKVAVDSVWLGIPAGERFGLLGSNGAGKTTMLSILCGDANPTSGDATVCGASCVGDRGEVQKRIGCE